jgi:hypothetical protein
MKVTDHLGNEFESIKEMCEFHHIPSKIYDHRVNRLHWSMEKALTTPLKVNKNEDIKKTQEESKETVTAKTEKTVSIEETVQVEQPKDVVKTFKILGATYNGTKVLQSLGFADDFIHSIINDLNDDSLTRIVRFELKKDASTDLQYAKALNRLLDAFDALMFVKNLKLDKDIKVREQFRQKLLEFAA